MLRFFHRTKLFVFLIVHPIREKQLRCTGGGLQSLKGPQPGVLITILDSIWKGWEAVRLTAGARAAAASCYQECLCHALVQVRWLTPSVTWHLMGPIHRHTASHTQQESMSRDMPSCDCLCYALTEFV